MAELWNSSKRSDGEKAAWLVREVFFTQEALAEYLRCHRTQVGRLIAAPKGVNADDAWGDTFDGSADRLWRAYVYRVALTRLSSPSYLTLACSRFFVPPESHPNLLAYFAGLRDGPSRWSANLGTTLGECLALCERDYSCWTDQVVPSWNLATCLRGTSRR